MGNATQVHQVMMNLCTNAAQAMGFDGGTLDVSVSDIPVDLIVGINRSDLKKEDYVEIRVSDTGVGIPQDEVGFIFEPYFTTKAPGEGTGMGLAMVQGIVETYGGQIIVSSKKGEGTTFKIYLPITTRRSIDREYLEQELPTGQERILFIDDEAKS